MRVAYFAALQRITMMPAETAAGEYSPTLFVFKGKALPYRNVARGSHPVAETYADYRPHDAVISMCEDRGDVHMDNLYQ